MWERFQRPRCYCASNLFFLVVLTLASASVSAATINTGLVGNGQTLNIAVVVNCVSPKIPMSPTLPQLLDPAVINITDCSFGLPTTALYDGWWKTHTTFKRVVAEQGGIPTDTGFLAQLNIVYFNVGGIDYTSTDNTTIIAQYKQAALNSKILAQQLGAYGGYNSVNNTWNAPCPYCLFPVGIYKPGVYGRFPIIMPPVFSDNLADLSGTPPIMSETFYRGCQLSKQCIVIGQLEHTLNWRSCRSQPQYVTDPTNPFVPLLINTVPMECNKSVDPTLRIDKRPNQRRFDYGFTALPSQQAMLSQLVSWFHLKGATTAVMFITDNSDFDSQILAPGLEQLALNEISLLMPVITFPSGRIWTDDEAMTYAQQVVGFNPDLVFMITKDDNNVLSSFNVLKAFRTLQWTPKAQVMLGGGVKTVSSYMNQQRVGDGGYYYGATFVDFRLRGASYRATTGTATDPNWDPFPTSADGSKQSPEVLRDEYVKDWGDTTPISLMNGNDQILVTMMPLVIATKIFYAAGTDDATLMQQASLSLTTPSIFGLLQFDQYGRVAQDDQFVVQFGKTGTDFHLITPLDVGDPDIYPMPTWAERVAPTDGSASFLGTTDEKGVVAVTTIVNFYLLALLVGVFMKRTTALMKAASPMFCGLGLIGGMICVSSNYGNSFYAVSSGCGANVWLLTTGFTMLFSALFVKTWRIWKIFRSGKLQVVKIKDTDLYIIVGVLVGIDILVNIIWSGVTGFPTEYVTMDPYRPIYDYVQCQYSSTSRDFVYFHVVYKSLVIVAGIALSIAARNVPAMFNETPALIASMYNCTLIFAFLIPLVATGVGGRHTTYLIRCYGILVLVVSTASILFVPKFLVLWRSRKDSGSGSTGIAIRAAAQTQGSQYNLDTKLNKSTPPMGEGINVGGMAVKSAMEEDTNSHKRVYPLFSAGSTLDSPKASVFSFNEGDVKRPGAGSPRLNEQLQNENTKLKAENQTLRQRLIAAGLGSDLAAASPSSMLRTMSQISPTAGGGRGAVANGSLVRLPSSPTPGGHGRTATMGSDVNSGLIRTTSDVQLPPDVQLPGEVAEIEEPQPIQTEQV